MSELDEVRNEIAEVDKEIVRQLALRNKLSEKIAEIKSSMGMEIVVPKQQEKVVERFVSEGKINCVSSNACERIAWAVIDESICVQRRKK